MQINPFNTDRFIRYMAVFGIVVILIAFILKALGVI
jgi:hypothetical protein